MAQAKVTWGDLDGIAVTIGPGLAGSLLVGVNAAKAIALARGLPITGVNHLEGHIYANWLIDRDIAFPLVCLIVSGGQPQVEIHARYGGIVPEVASRQHILAIIPILKQAMAQAKVIFQYQTYNLIPLLVIK